MTTPDGYFPTDAINYTSIAALAAKTDEDIANELSIPEETRWGIIGDGMASKWTDLDAALANAAYAAAQIVALSRPIHDFFDTAAGSLSSNWDTFEYDSGSGEIAIDGDGHAYWDKSGGTSTGWACRWNADTTASDYQIVSVVMSERVQQTWLGADSYMLLLGRVVDTGDIEDFVYAAIYYDSVEIGYCASGTFHTLASDDLDLAHGDVWDFNIGTIDDHDEFTLMRNGVQVLSATSASPSSGSGYRSIGFGMFAGTRSLLFDQTTPGELAMWSADEPDWGS